VFSLIGLEAVEDRLPVLLSDLAVILQWAEWGQRLGQRFERPDPLREDDRLAIVLGDFIHVGNDLFELDTLAGARIEVANLLEPGASGLGKAYRSVRSRRASPCGNPQSGPE
jgi:hypothetical protein